MVIQRVGGGAGGPTLEEQKNAPIPPPKHNSLFDDDDERDMPITANDLKRLENSKKQIPIK